MLYIGCAILIQKGKCILVGSMCSVVGCASRMLASACVLCMLAMCIFVQHDSKCRHMSLSLRLQRLLSGEILCLSVCFFQKIPMYSLYWNLGICASCVSFIQRVSHNMFEHFGWRSLLVCDLLAYGLVLEAMHITTLLCSQSMYILRFLGKPSCWLDVGVMDGQKSVW